MANDHMETKIENLIEVYQNIENLHDKGYLSDEEYNIKNNQLLRNLMAIIAIQKSKLEKTKSHDIKDLRDIINNTKYGVDNTNDARIIKVCIAKLRNLVNMLDVNKITSDEFIERVKLVLKDLVGNIKDISLFFIESYLDPNNTYVINRRYAEYIKDSNYARMMYDNGLKESNVNENDDDKKHIADVYEPLANIPNPQEHRGEVDVSGKFKNDDSSNNTKDEENMKEDYNKISICVAKLDSELTLYDDNGISADLLIEKVKEITAYLLVYAPTTYLTYKSKDHRKSHHDITELYDEQIRLKKPTSDKERLRYVKDLINEILNETKEESNT